MLSIPLIKLFIEAEVLQKIFACAHSAVIPLTGEIWYSNQSREGHMPQTRARRVRSAAPKAWE